MIAGSLIGLIVNGSFVSCETACQINFSVDMLPASAVDSGRWKEFVQGIRSWTVSVNGNLLLEAVPSDIKAIISSGFINGTPLYVQFSTRPAASIQLVFSGAALFSQGNISAPSNGAANWTATFQGNGALASEYIDFDLLIDAMPIEADYPIIIDEDYTT